MKWHTYNNMWKHKRRVEWIIACASLCPVEALVLYFSPTVAPILSSDTRVQFFLFLSFKE